MICAKKRVYRQNGNIDPNISFNTWYTKLHLFCFRRLKSVMEDDALYASYFWWKDFYQVRTEALDNAQVITVITNDYD